MTLVRRGHMPPPEPRPASGIFAMATRERTTALLRAAGFTEARTEGVAVGFALPDVDGYLGMVGDTAGRLALALRELGEAEWSAVRADVQDALSRFAVADGYHLPGVAVCAVAT